jgi:DNA-binding CsgD family transcriptional regulator
MRTDSHQRREPTKRAGAALAAAEVSGIFEVMTALYEANSLEMFPDRLLTGLRQIIPFQVGGCHVIDRDYQVVSACIQPQMPCCVSHLEEYRRLARLHPLNPLLRAHPARAFLLTDVLSLKQFLQTELYGALYQPLGVNRELVAMVPAGAACGSDPALEEKTPLAGEKTDSSCSSSPVGPEAAPGGFLRISLRRLGRNFSEHERSLLNLLLPLIRRARQCLEGRLLAAADRVMGAGPKAGAEGTGGGAMGDGLDRIKDESAFYEWTRSETRWRLTRRESDVLFWLSQGKTNAEIGRILGMAERTAETHALRSYPKLGVENRHGAIVLVTRLLLRREPLPSAPV